MIIANTCVIAIAVIAFILGVRPKDLPEPEAVSPFRHLDERKASIYENLRDLQFEYRVGKLSDEDYQTTKKDLQKELAGVLAEVDKVRMQLGMNGAVPPRKPAPKAEPAKAAAAKVSVAQPEPPKPAERRPAGFVCDSCGAEFEKELKFCGECGKPMKVSQ